MEVENLRERIIRQVRALPQAKLFELAGIVEHLVANEGPAEGGNLQHQHVVPMQVRVDAIVVGGSSRHLIAREEVGGRLTTHLKPSSRRVSFRGAFYDPTPLDADGG